MKTKLLKKLKKKHLKKIEIFVRTTSEHSCYELYYCGRNITFPIRIRSNNILHYSTVKTIEEVAEGVGRRIRSFILEDIKELRRKNLKKKLQKDAKNFKNRFYKGKISFR